MNYVTRYLYGWVMFARCFYKMRFKKHGAGKQALVICWRAGMAYRWIVDGQFRNGRFLGYLNG
jgi:hypothetical protein